MVATPRSRPQIAHFRTKHVSIFAPRQLRNGWTFGPRTCARLSECISISGPQGCEGVAAPFLQRQDCPTSAVFSVPTVHTNLHTISVSEKPPCQHFCTTRSQSWLACDHCDRRSLTLHDLNVQAPWFPASSRRSVTHLRNAKGGCVGGLKRKVLVLNGPNRQKRPKNGSYQAHRGHCGDGYGPSEAP